MYSSISSSGVKCTNASIVSLRWSHFSWCQGMTTETLCFDMSCLVFGQPGGRVSGGIGKVSGSFSSLFFFAAHGPTARKYKTKHDILNMALEPL